MRWQCVSLVTCRADFLSSYNWNSYNWNKKLTFLGWRLVVVMAEAFKSFFRKCFVIWVLTKLILFLQLFSVVSAKGAVAFFLESNIMQSSLLLFHFHNDFLALILRVFRNFFKFRNFSFFKVLVRCLVQSSQNGTLNICCISR